MRIPLPVIWQCPVGSGYFTPVVAPLPGNGSVTVRCGDELVALADSDGERLWAATLAPRAGDGHFLLRHADLLLTDVVRRPERLGSVLAVYDGGEPAWRVDLPGIIAPKGATMIGDSVLSVLVTEPGDGTVAYLLDARTGEQTRRVPLPRGADELIGWRDGFLVRSQASGGLYTLAFDGSMREISPDQTWRLSAEDELLVTSAGGATGKPGTLHTYARPDLRELWSGPALVETPVLDGGTVYAVDGDTLVASRASDGTELWRSEPLAHDVLTVHVAGPLIFCVHLSGVALHRRGGGEPAGELTGYHAPPVSSGGHLYLVGDATVSCLAV